MSFEGVTLDALLNSLTLGVALGLVLGKLLGVFGSAYLVIRLGFADVPLAAGKLQLLGVLLLCGIGFTMTLFFGMLAFANNPGLQADVKIGILGGSLLADLIGWAILRVAPREIPAPKAAARIPAWGPLALEPVEGSCKTGDAHEG